LAPADAVEAIVTIGRGGRFDRVVVAAETIDLEKEINLRTASTETVRTEISRLIDRFPDAQALRIQRIPGIDRQVRVEPILFSEGPVLPENGVSVDQAVRRLLKFGEAGFRSVIVVLPEREEKVDLQAVSPDKIREIVSRVPAAAFGENRLPDLVRLERAVTGEGIIRVSPVPSIPLSPVSVEEAIRLVRSLRFGDVENVILALPDGERRLNLKVAGQREIEEGILQVVAGVRAVTEQPIQISPVGPALSQGLRISAAGLEGPLPALGFFSVDQAAELLSRRSAGVERVNFVRPDQNQRLDLRTARGGEIRAALEQVAQQPGAFAGAVRLEASLPGNIQVSPVPAFAEPSFGTGIISADQVTDRLLSLKGQQIIRSVSFVFPGGRRSIDLATADEFQLNVILTEITSGRPAGPKTPVLFAPGEIPQQLLVTPLPDLDETTLAARIIPAEAAVQAIFNFTDIGQFDRLLLEGIPGETGIQVDLREAAVPDLQARMSAVAAGSQGSYAGIVQVIKEPSVRLIRVRPIPATGPVSQAFVQAGPAVDATGVRLGEGIREAGLKFIFRPDNAGLALLVPKGMEKNIRIVFATPQQARYLLSQRPSLAGTFVSLDDFDSVESAVLFLKSQPGWLEATDVKDILPRDFEALRHQIEAWLAPFDWEMPDLRDGVLEAILFGSQV
ncbi:MAG: hypothetical protein NC819_02750, partial [Candidatus Omnitrophica bacterium]|nr:hypothetical protein [Candidatus Omnitrophota bacterium]